MRNHISWNSSIALASVSARPKRNHRAYTDAGTFEIVALFSFDAFVEYSVEFHTNGLIRQSNATHALGRFRTLKDAKRACEHYYRNAPRDEQAFV